MWFWWRSSLLISMYKPYLCDKIQKLYHSSAWQHQKTTRALFKISRRKIPTELTFLWVDSKSRLIPWIQFGIHEKSTGFRGFFKKSRLFVEIEEEGRHYSVDSFAMGNGCQCIWPQSSKTVFMIRKKESTHWIDSFSHFFVLKTGSTRRNGPHKYTWYRGFL
jgi:hypothetical protein